LFLSPAQASDIGRRGRQLLQSGQLTHHQYSLLDTLLWRCRKHGQAAACVSYSGLQRLCHMATDTVWRGLARLEQLGLIQKVRRRVRVAWATRQATSLYIFHAETNAKHVSLLPAATDSDERSVLREIVIQKEAQEDALTAQRALARVRAVMEQRLRSGRGVQDDGALDSRFDLRA
jgi:hypothetical protein